MNKYTKQWSASELFFLTEICSFDGDGVSVNNQMAAGVATHGPYVLLSAGKYQGCIEYSSDNAFFPAGSYDVGVFDIPLYLHQGLLPAKNGRGILSFEFSVPEPCLKQVEIRTLNNGSGHMLVIHTISIEYLDELSPDDHLSEYVGNLLQSKGIKQPIPIKTFEQYDDFIEKYRRQDFGGVGEKEE